MDETRPIHISPSGTEFGHVVSVDLVENGLGGLGIVIGVHMAHPPMTSEQAEAAVERPDLEALVTEDGDVIEALREAIRDIDERVHARSRERAN